MSKNRIHISFYSLTLLLVTVLLSFEVQAQENLLMNPGFDEDLTGWVDLYGRPNSWTMEDASNSPLSGSARIGNDVVSSGGTLGVLGQCLPMTGSTEISFGGQFNVLPDQPEDARGSVVIVTYSGSDCSGDAFDVIAAGSAEVGSWEVSSTTLVTDSLTRSIKVSLGVSKPTGVAELAEALFDNVFLYATEAGAYRIIDEKLSGSWFNSAWPGQGLFFDISPEINLFFVGWFTWTTTPGQIDWVTLQGGFSGDVATLTMHRTTGGKLNDPTPVDTQPIGIAEIRFLSCTMAEFSYKLDGDADFTVILLTRLTPAFKGCVD